MNLDNHTNAAVTQVVDVPVSHVDQARTDRVIWFGFGAMLILVALLFGFVISELRKMDVRVNAIIRGGLERTTLAQEMYKAARERSLLLATIVNDSDPFEQDEHLQRYYNLAGRFSAARAKLIELGVSVEEQQLLTHLTEAITTTTHWQLEVIDGAQQNRTEEARALLVREAIPAQEKVLSLLAELSGWATQTAHAQAKEAHQGFERTRVVLWAGGALMLLCGVGVAGWVRQRLFHLASERAALIQALHDTLRDLSFQKQAMDAHAIVSIADAAGNMTYVNDKFLQISGYSKDELIGKNQHLLQADTQTEGLLNDLWTTISTGQVWRGEVCHRAKNGQDYWVSTTIVPFLDVAGLPKQYISVRSDITPMKISEAALWKAKQELEQRVVERTAALRDQLHFTTELMEALPNPVFYKDVKGHYLGVNKAWEEMFGVSRNSIVGKRDTLYTQAPEIAAKHAVMDEELWCLGAQQSYEIAVPVARGEVRDTVYYRAALTNKESRVTGLVGVIVDVTERKHGEAELKRRYEQVQALNTKLQDMQHQLLQSEKMASVGQLAAGVAHEINNPIGYIFSNLGSLDRYLKNILSVMDTYEDAEAAIMDVPTLTRVKQAKDASDLAFIKEDIQSLMGECKEGITRVKKIVQDLKDFSHIDSNDEWQWVDLHQGLDSTLNIVRNELKYKAEIVKQYADLPEVECLPSQLNQVFLNLLVNAGHAIEVRGTITLRSGVADEQVWVEIEDSGKGIAPEHLQRIFDPFFTTKPVGTGTGLGLSLSYGIIQKHHGKIEVNSELGRGTRFRVWLPIQQQAELAIEGEHHA